MMCRYIESTSWFARVVEECLSEFFRFTLPASVAQIVCLRFLWVGGWVGVWVVAADQ